METFDCTYEAHLNLRDFSVPTGGEWPLPFTGWWVVHVRRGTGYYLQPQMSQILETGVVLLAAGGAAGHLRASQLDGLSLCAFNVIPERLAGLITLVEGDMLKVAKQENAVRIFPPHSPVTTAMMELQAGRNRNGLRFRLKLCQLFVEMAGNDLEQIERIPSDEDAFDAKTRLQLFLKQTPSNELLELDFNELAQKIHCTARHLSRIFHDVVGMSFSRKRTELRLERSRELLAAGNAKIVEVALQSGYKSLSLFNLMFARRFGSSPGKWRQKHKSPDAGTGHRKLNKLLPGNKSALFLPEKAVASRNRNDSCQPVKPLRDKTRLTKEGGRISIYLNRKVA